MNKIGKILIVIIVLTIGGYFIFINLNSSNNLEDKIKKASSDYFEKYISTNETMSAYKVTLKELIESGENYDLNELNKCDKEKTYAVISIDYKTGSPKKVEVELKC